MIEVLFEIIPYAVGIAISPVPIITVILSLFSTRAGWNGPAFCWGGHWEYWWFVFPY
jgi:hypothetical protein